MPNIRLDYDHIRDTITEGTVRERHVAKALQQVIAKLFPPTAERAKALKNLYGTESQIDLSDDVALQNELRSKLLKAGKVAFVEDNPEAYLSLDEAKSLIQEMGGVPCYPVLASGTKQGYTFTYALVDSESFTLNADPTVTGKTGTRHFFSNETSVIRGNSSGTAGVGDAVVQ